MAKIVILSPVFPPEPMVSAKTSYDLACALVDDGKESMALALIGNIDNRYARAILIAKVVGELVEKQEIKKAIQVTEKMDDDVPPDALIEVARGFAELGEVKHATQMAMRLEVKGSRIAALTEIVHVLTEKELYDDALEVTKELERQKARSVEQLKIVKAMAENGHAAKALLLTTEIESPLYQIFGLNRVAVAIAGHVFEEFV